MKKYLALLLALIVLCSLFACGKKDTSADTTGTGAAVTTGGDTVRETEKKPADTTAEKKETDPIIVTEEPTETTLPPETEPIALTVPSAGFCAVGEVDAASGKVAVLFANGLVETMTYVGDVDPVSGTVMRFESEENMIAFAEVAIDDYSSWRIQDAAGADYFYGNDGTQEYFCHFSTECAGFIKFSDTSWRAYSGSEFIQVASGLGDGEGTAWWCNLCAVFEDPYIVLVYVDASHEFVPASGDPLQINPVRFFSANAEEFTEGNRDVVLAG